MKKFALASLLAITLVITGALPSDAGRGGHGGGHHGGFGHHHFVHGGTVFVGVGPIWWDPWWYYPPPYYGYAAPPIVVQEPTVYVQQQPVPSAPQGDWYYCASTRNYYPNVPTCAEPWIRVAPRTQ
ncbi:MAG: hypothetical protein DMD91_27875 [Candidatus Rokuibacteriota bacterium]|nr:MAG: hypothetical protein DMD91_27875 [Candidatus Rokubacteria bacterium]